jgi:hypothetical protein
MAGEQKWPASHFLADLGRRSVPRTERLIGSQPYLKLVRWNRPRQALSVYFTQYTHNLLFSTLARRLQEHQCV